MILLRVEGTTIEYHDWLQSLNGDEWVDAFPITCESFARIAWRTVCTFPGHRIVSKGLDACVVLARNVS
jgi:hypothetical protein